MNTEDIITDVEGPSDSDLDDPEIAEILREMAIEPPITQVRWWEGSARMDPNKILIPDYQMTTIDRKQTDNIVTSGWKEELSPPLLLNHRDGNYYVYVGRHRLLSIRELIKIGRLPTDYKVESVVRSMSLKQEQMAFFEAEERNRTGREKYINGVLIGAPVYDAVNALANRFGFYHVYDPKSRTVKAQFRFRCEQEMLSIYRGDRLKNESYKGPLSPQDGPAVLAVVLYLHNKCWAPRASQTHGNILRHATVGALAEIIYEHGSSHRFSTLPFSYQQRGQINMDELEVILQQHTPDKWVDIANKAPILGGERVYELMSKLMLFGKEYRKTADLKLWYNRKRRGPDRLSLFI